nr:TniQ family protein [uncultured Rhodopila sp.]
MTTLPLILQPPPRADESVRGLVVRHAELNHCTADIMCSWLGLPAMGQPLDVHPEAAAATIPMDVHRLGDMGFGSDGIEAFLGYRVPVTAIARKLMRFCPDCFAEAHYHRRIWEHRQIDACPIHHLKLVSACPSCETQTVWKRGQLTACDCGQDLIEGATRIPLEDCIGVAAIYRLCGVVSDGPVLPASFASLPLQELIDLLYFLGRMEMVLVQGNEAGFGALNMLRDGRVLNHGVRIAMGWPDAFGQLADRVRAARDHGKSISVQYGHLHRFIHGCGKAAYASFLRDAYAEHLARRGDVVGRAWPTFLDRPDGAGGDAMTRGEVRGHLGIGAKSFATLQRTPMWDKVRPVMSGQRGTPQYASADVAALKKRLNRLVSPYDADRMLSVGRGKAQQLIEAGLLPVVNWNRRNRRGEGRSFDRADVEALLQRAREFALGQPPREGISFTTVRIMVGQRPLIAFPDVIRCLVTGRLRGHIANPGNFGFSAFVFEEADVREVLNELVRQSQKQDLTLG